ncbi:MAG: hypothetical protein KF701_00535 [Anaerolineales bacterium]|nr:MAG: hypothetical protein KF701_00535 [Anaerolineales bacterium]
MHKTPRAIAWALSALLLSSLACTTLLGEPEAERDYELDLRPTQPPTQPAPAVLTQRLDGLQLLPDLALAPPARSPNDSDRPRLSGVMYVLDTQNFRIHYTREGEDAVPPAQTTDSGHPDYVIEVARAMEYSWFASIDHFGWAPPPPDFGLGGDDRYDVYLMNIMDEDYAGYTDSDYDDPVIGDNPNSPLVELASTHTHLVLDNDYLEDYDYNEDGTYPIAGLNYMRSTAAHEFHHAIQFGYDGEEPHDWVWEATSTWIEEELFNSVNDPVYTLDSVMKSPDSCQLAEGGEVHDDDLDRWYGMWIFMRHLSEQYGHGIVLRLWEHIIELDGYAAWDAVLAEYGTTLEDVFLDYSIVLLTRDFEEGLRYPTVALEGTANLNEWFVSTTGVHQLGADYISLPFQETITVTLEAEGMLGAVVGITEGRSYIYPLWDGELSLDSRWHERTYLVVMNMERAVNARNCFSSDYSVFVIGGGSPQEPEWSLAASNFQPPRP